MLKSSQPVRSQPCVLPLRDVEKGEENSHQEKGTDLFSQLDRKRTLRTRVGSALWQNKYRKKKRFAGNVCCTWFHISKTFQQGWKPAQAGSKNRKATKNENYQKRFEKNRKTSVEQAEEKNSCRTPLGGIALSSGTASSASPPVAQQLDGLPTEGR